MIAGKKLVLGMLVSAFVPSVALAEEIALFVKTPVKPEHRDRYMEAVRSNLVETRNEKGARRFDVYQDATLPDVFYQFEVWSGADAHAAHLKKPYAVAAAGARKNGQAGESEVIRLVPYRSSAAEKVSEDRVEGSQNLIVVFEPKEQLKEEFLSEFDKVAKESRKADGNLAFELYRSTDPEGKFVLYERWESPAHYAKHIATPYVAEFYKHFDAVVNQRVKYIGKDLAGK